MGEIATTERQSSQVSAYERARSEGMVPNAGVSSSRNGALNTSVISPPKSTLSAPTSMLASSDIGASSSSGGNAVWDFFKSMFVDDFLKAGKALLQSGFQQFKSIAHALLAGGKLLIGDIKGAEIEAQKSFNAMKLAGQVLLQNAIEIVFAVATVVSLVGSAGAATAGVIALRQLLKEGVKHAIKEVGKLAAERVTTWGVSQVAKLSSVKAALPLTKEAAEVTTKLSGKISKVFGKELLDVAKVAERESQMLDKSKDVLNASLEASRKSGKSLDIPKIEKSLTDANKSVLVDGDFEKLMEDKLHDLLKLAETPNMTKAEVSAMKGEIRAIGFVDDEVEEVYSLLTNRSFRIALNSGQYDAEISGELIKVLKSDLGKTVQEGLKSGKLGKEYLAGWEKHLDDLYKKGEISAEERDALKAAGKNAIEKGYKDGVDEAIEKAVNNAFKRLRQRDSDNDTIHLDDGKKKKKQPSLFSYIRKIIEEEGMHVNDAQAHRPSPSVVIDAAKDPRKAVHWLRQYFLDREKREQLLGVSKETKMPTTDSKSYKPDVVVVPPPKVISTVGTGENSRAA